MPNRAVPPDEGASLALSRVCQYLFELSDQPTAADRGPDHIVRYANPAFGRLSGRPPGKLVGWPFADACQWCFL